MIQKLSIIIPAFNEEKTIAQVLDIVSNLRLVHDIEKEILDAGFQILYLYINSGKRMIPVLERETALRSDPVVLRIIATKNFVGE